MSRIGRSEISHGEILSVDEVLARTDAVTIETATEAARDVFSRPMALAVVGPFEEDAFQDALGESLVPTLGGRPEAEPAAAHHGSRP
jgi:hypothetical protein